jgi:hypothetical protein
MILNSCHLFVSKSVQLSRNSCHSFISRVDRKLILNNTAFQQQNSAFLFIQQLLLVPVDMPWSIWIVSNIRGVISIRYRLGDVFNTGNLDSVVNSWWAIHDSPAYSSKGNPDGKFLQRLPSVFTNRESWLPSVLITGKSKLLGAVITRFGHHGDLKGTLARDFRHSFFSSKASFWSPDQDPKLFSNINSNSPRYSNSNSAYNQNTRKEFFFFMLWPNNRLVLTGFRSSCTHTYILFLKVVSL